MPEVDLLRAVESVGPQLVDLPEQHLPVNRLHAEVGAGAVAVDVEEQLAVNAAGREGLGEVREAAVPGLLSCKCTTRRGAGSFFELPVYQPILFSCQSLQNMPNVLDMFWKCLQNTLRSGNRMDFPALPADMREMSDEKIPILRNFMIC